MAVAVKMELWRNQKQLQKRKIKINLMHFHCSYETKRKLHRASLMLSGCDVTRNAENELRIQWASKFLAVSHIHSLSVRRFVSHNIFFGNYFCHFMVIVHFILIVFAVWHRYENSIVCEMKSKCFKLEKAIRALCSRTCDSIVTFLFPNGFFVKVQFFIWIATQWSAAPKRLGSNSHQI